MVGTSDLSRVVFARPREPSRILRCFCPPARGKVQFTNASGLALGCLNGSFALVEIPDPKLGPRKMDVETMYNKERLRPNYSNKVGVPIFLTRA